MICKSSKIYEIFLAFRPKTLTAAIVPCFVGSAWCWSHARSFDGFSFGLALLSSVFIQIATNFFNDAIDFKKGVDNEKRLGPRRMTQSGVFGPRAVLGLGSCFLLIALICGIPLLFRGGEPIFYIGIFSLFLAYGYTGGPYPLAYKGLGDLFVVLFFGVIAVSGMAYLHLLKWTFEPIILGIQIGFLAAVLIAINNLRDIKTDAEGDKRTLAVRLGERGAKWEILFLVVTPFVLNIFWALEGFYFAALLPFLIFPLAFNLLKNVFRNPPSSVYNDYLGGAALIHLFFGVLLSVGFLVS